jgi:hypothetical protein
MAWLLAALVLGGATGFSPLPIEKVPTFRLYREGQCIAQVGRLPSC